MSQISETSRTIQQADTQSLQSAQALNVQQAASSQSQQRSGAQVERSGRSDRQRVQRSSSSASSRSGTAGARVEGAVGTGSYQQYSAEGGFSQTNNASFGSAASGERRQGRYRRQVIRLPDQAQGQVRQVRRRLPTPEPDTLERVYIQRAAGEVVEEITEIPTTPPPRIQERTVVEPAGPPQVIKRTIRVPPRSGGFGGYQQQQQQGASFQAASNVVGTGGFGSIPQATSSYQQAGANYSGGYSAGTAIPAATSGFGSIGGGYQQPVGQAPIVFSVGGAGSSQPLPPVGCQPAFCFYV